MSIQRGFAAKVASLASTIRGQHATTTHSHALILFSLGSTPTTKTAWLAPGVTTEWQKQSRVGVPVEDAEHEPRLGYNRMPRRRNLQYACPRCDDDAHIRINGAHENNVRCTVCGWVGSSTAASLAADELADGLR